VVINPNTTIVPSVISNELTIYSDDNQIHILYCESNSTITIYDILGRQHYFGMAKSDNEVITCNFKTGIYIVKVSNNHNVKSKKVFIL